MESTILAILGGIGGMGGFAGLVMLFNAWRESRRKDKEQESQLIQIAAKFNLEATSSATTLFSNIADRLDTENKGLRERIVVLEVAKQDGEKARQERDKQIDDLKHGQEKMISEMETLRVDNATLIKENDTLRQENAQLKTDNATIKADNTTIKAQVRIMIAELKKANLPLPDGVENGEK